MWIFIYLKSSSIKYFHSTFKVCSPNIRSSRFLYLAVLERNYKKRKYSSVGVFSNLVLLSACRTHVTCERNNHLAHHWAPCGSVVKHRSAGSEGLDLIPRRELTFILSPTLSTKQMSFFISRPTSIVTIFNGLRNSSLSWLIFSIFTCVR